MQLKSCWPISPKSRRTRSMWTDFSTTSVRRMKRTRMSRKSFKTYSLSTRPSRLITTIWRSRTSHFNRPISNWPARWTLRPSSRSLTRRSMISTALRRPLRSHSSVRRWTLTPSSTAIWRAGSSTTSTMLRKFWPPINDSFLLISQESY